MFELYVLRYNTGNSPIISYIRNTKKVSRDMRNRLMHRTIEVIGAIFLSMYFLPLKLKLLPVPDRMEVVTLSCSPTRQQK